LSHLDGKTFLFEWKRLGHLFPGKVETIFHIDELPVLQTPQFNPKRNGLSLSSFGIPIARQLKWEEAIRLGERMAQVIETQGSRKLLKCFFP